MEEILNTVEQIILKFKSAGFSLYIIFEYFQHTSRYIPLTLDSVQKRAMRLIFLCLNTWITVYGSQAT